MTKWMLLLLLPLLCPDARAQYAAWELERIKPDSLTSVSTDIRIRPTNLADTLKVQPHRIDYYKKPMAERFHSDGRLTLRFEPQEYNLDWVLQENYAFPLHLTRPLGKGLRFEADWSYFVPRKPNFYSPYYDPQEVVQSRDTLITVISVAEAGGVTPEGQVYRFCGDNVKSIKTQTRAVFYVSLAVDPDDRDGWYVPVGRLETPVQTTPADRGGYRLPILRDVVVDVMQFTALRARIVETLRRVLAEKRTIASERDGDAEFRMQKLEEMQKRLAPNWEQGGVHTFSGLSAEVGLCCFITNAVVEMKDGRTERFVHVASYEASVP